MFLKNSKKILKKLWEKIIKFYWEFDKTIEEQIFLKVYKTWKQLA